jgi:hypothetical protein
MLPLDFPENQNETSTRRFKTSLYEPDAPIAAMQEVQSNDYVIAQVETFIQRYHDLEFVVTEDARSLTGREDTATGKRFLWVNNLADSISNYSLNRDKPQFRLKYAQDCLGFINKAFAAGIIRDGPGLITKHKEAESKIAQLEAQVKKLSEENIFLNAKIDLMREGVKF